MRTVQEVIAGLEEIKATFEFIGDSARDLYMDDDSHWREQAEIVGQAIEYLWRY